MRESGLYRGETSFTPGDVFRIAVEGGVVSYYKNSVRLYRSQIAPAYPLLVDTALLTMGATIQSVVLAQGGS